MSETKGVLNEQQIYNCDTDLETEYNQLKCNENNYYSANCNKFQLKKELVERECLKEEEVDEEDPFLYPNLNDTNFNIKIAEKKEFNDNKYDGTIHANVKEHADILANADFELSPHQAFVKNFLSFQTPYNSLLLYHGLGSGKTCSAIGVCEEMRDYLKQMGISKRIIIVASENVQDNFKLQLFDERKLKQVDGLWTIRGCVGNKLLKEINPMSMKGMSKDKVVSQIKALINTTYLFLGYGQFANYIIKTIKYDENVSLDEYLEETKKKGPTKIETITNLDKKMIQRLKAEFNNRMIVIDEVHNIRKEDDNKNKKVAINLEILVKAAENMRFLFLSATPMYNNYTEIIWLLNIMNTNDRRGKISVSDVFDKEGNFKPGGEDLLIRKATGYISFVRGENPYTFPYRVYPVNFAEENTFITNEEDEPLYHSYPNYQMNGIEIKQEEDSKNLIQYLKYNINSIYLNTIGNCNLCGVCQACAYKYIIYNLKNKTFNITTKTGQIRQMPKFEDMESFGYTLLQTPLESLIISYPIRELKGALDKISNGSEREGEREGEGEAEIYIDPHDLTGKKGLERMMTCIDSKSPPEKGSFEYKRSTLETYDRIFSKELIGSYSSKIKSILDKIVSPETGEISDGIILIYSQYIDGGLIPVALALEEMGFTRYGKGTKNLFKTSPTEPLMLSMSNNTKLVPARYSMITGDIRISPDNDFEIKGLTGEDNKDGYKVKVILISKAGSEGIDLKFIRQVHILEPWYNMNLLEQVIGRAVRNFSHKDLPFEKRNVQIFMYGTLIDDNKEETADLYVYRVAGVKAIQIGKISRLLKQTAVDCIINHDQQNFSQQIMLTNIEGTITQELSTGKTITDFKIGDAPFSPACDYLSTCTFDCIPDKKITDADLNEDTYNENYIIVNSDKILQRIRMIMKEGFFYKKDVLINAIKTPKEYPLVQIYAALTQLIEDSSEIIEDKYGRPGRLINIGDYYLFQPSELTYKNASIYDRSVPIDVKHSTINFGIEKQLKGKKNRGLVVEEEEEEEEEVVINPDRFIEGKKIFDEIKTNFALANKFTIRKIETDIETSEQRIVPSKVDRGDDNWYKHSGIVISKLKDEGIPLTDLFSFVVYHAIELLSFEDKVELLNYIYSLESIQQNSVEDLVKQYFSKNSIHITKMDLMGNKQIVAVAFVLFKLNKLRIMILKNKIWVEGQPEDERKVKESEEGVIYFEKLNKSLYNNIVGFIGYEKNNKYMVFKTKNLNSKRDTGARCDEAGKTKTMALLNEILGIEKYTNESTKKIVGANKTVISEAVSQDELCVTQEFYLRYFNKSNKNSVKWFLTPEMAIYYELYKIVLK